MCIKHDNSPILREPHRVAFNGNVWAKGVLVALIYAEPFCGRSLVLGTKRTVGAGSPWPHPGLLARALESPVVEACSFSRADGVSRALSGPWVLAALCVVPSELARAAFEES